MAVSRSQHLIASEVFPAGWGKFSTQRLPRPTLIAALHVSAAIHAIACAVLVAIATTPAAIPSETAVEPSVRPSSMATLVFVAKALPTSEKAAGGGGGGNRQPGPMRRAQAHGSDAATLRIVRPVDSSDRSGVDVVPLPGVLLDAKPLASGDRELMGWPSAGVDFGTSTGEGSGGGVGTGTGSGIGPGRGPGLGEGAGGGSGGGVYRPGGSVTPPTVIIEVHPTYTTDALERRIQGTVVLELIVTADGMPSRIRVVRSLDPDGLDGAATEAVGQWRFRPGKKDGTPVAVLVTIFLDFTIR